MLLVIDNFDSFTYNLVQYLGELGAELRVFRNDALTVHDIAAMQPAGIVISPGPGRPEDAGISMSVIQNFGGKIPLLGVCLGHQAIGAAFGGAITRAPELMHGKVSRIHHDGRGLFRKVENPFTATRYHSLIIAEDNLPSCLEVTARSESGLIMGVRHREFVLEGVQFHPESIMTTVGKHLLANFLEMCSPTFIAHAEPRATISSVAPASHAKSQAMNSSSATNSTTHAKPVGQIMQRALQQLLDHVDLEREQAYDVMMEIMNGAATSAQIAAFLIAMRMKGERAPEVAGLAQAMRERATPVRTHRKYAVDMCGTGGDAKGTFNISTVASFVVAGGGVAVAKHGNRSVSSKCGSADVLEALGFNIALEAAQMSRCLDEVGMAFLFAPALHAATKHAVAPRKEIGARTVFNLLGPLTNPAGVKRQVLGVYDRRMMRLVAEVLASLGAEHALVVHSEDGLDEISVHGPTLVVEVQNGRLSERKVTPKDFGLAQVYQNGIVGGDAEQNAQLALRVLRGEPGAARDIVIANAACGLWVGGAATNIAEGVEKAKRSIDSGAALATLEALRKLSNSFNK